MARYILLLFLLLGKVSAAQLDLQWVDRFSSNENNYSRSMVIDKNGNIYTIGYAQGSTDLDPGSGTFLLSHPGSAGICFISKLNSSGNFEWAIEFDVNLSDIAVDDNLNVYVTGSVNDTICDLDPGPGIHNVSFPNYGTFVSKFNSSGNFLYARKLSGEGYIYSYSLALDAQSNVIVLGNFTGKTNFDPGADSTFHTTVPNQADIFVWKLDQNGNFIWVRTFGAGWNDSGNEITTDKNSNIYFTGKFMKYVDFDPGPGNSTLYSTLWDEIYVCKLTKNGDYVWAKQFGADGAGRSIQVDADENVVFSGFYKGTVDFDPGPATHFITANGNYNAFLAQLNKNGELNWVKSYGNYKSYCVINSIVIDANRNIYAIGGFSKSLEINPGASASSLTASGYHVDVLLLNLNPNGQLLWGQKIGGNYSDSGMDVALECGNIYITGIYRLSTDFDTSADTAFLVTRDTTVNNVFVGKYSLLSPLPDVVMASKDSICSGEPVSLTVNGVPLANGTNWQWYQGSCGGNYVGSGSSINILPAVSTTFSVRSEGNCRVSDCKPVSVNLKESPDASASLTCKADCSGVTMHCKNESVNADSYTWRFNDGSNSTEENPEHYFTFNEGFGISLTAINSNSGCRDTFNLGMSSVPLDWFRIVIPNVFTPNNDGINDELRVSSEASINNCFSLKVFNRWGNEIYSSNNLDSGWNGRSNIGESSEPGTYYYVLKVDEFEYQGTVTLLE